MSGFPWLTTTLVLPLVGAVVVALLPKRDARAGLPQKVALGFSMLTLAAVAAVAVQFDTSVPGYQFVENHVWIRSFGAHYALGVDGIGLVLLLLTAVLAPVVILASWHDGDGGRWSPNAFFSLALALEGLAVGAFVSIDVFLFYVFFEAILFPVYFLIGGFGGPRRSTAAVKFLVYSLLGGLLMLAAVIGLYVVSSHTVGGPTYFLPDLTRLHIGTVLGRWMFLGFFIAFAIKAPLFPLHTWLPDAVDQATPGTSVLLVSIMDKIGTFGMLRFCLGLFPEASRWATPVVLVLAVISIIYGAMMAIGQNNISRLVGYTSISHFGFIIMGIFVFNTQGQTGSTLYMFNHGLSTAALFLVTGFLIKRRGSQLITDYGGVEKVTPVLAGIFLVAGLSSMSLPGLSPFISEFLVLVGAFVHNVWYAIFAVTGIVLAALYILLMYQRTMTGPTRPEVAGFKDLGVREVVSLAPLLVLIVLLGFYPKPLTNVINPAVGATLHHVGTHDPAPAVPASQASGAEQENHQ